MGGLSFVGKSRYGGRLGIIAHAERVKGVWPDGHPTKVGVPHFDKLVKDVTPVVPPYALGGLDGHNIFGADKLPAD